MSFLVILVCGVVELVLAPFDNIRDSRWVRTWRGWLAGTCRDFSWWNGAAGVLLTVGLPMLAVGVIYAWLHGINAFLGFLAAVGVTLFCLGPGDLNRDIDRLLHATDDAERAHAGDALMISLDDVGAPGADSVIDGVVVEAHDRIFAPLVWLVLLGPVGIVLYRMITVLRRGGDPAEDEFGATAQQLYRILNFVPARLFALGFGIAGSLTHAFECWRGADDFSLAVGQSLLGRVARAAIHPAGDEDVSAAADPAARMLRVRGIRGLLNRTFVVWLTLLAALTIANLTH